MTYCPHYTAWGALAALQNGGAINVTDIFNNRLQPCWMYATTSAALPWSSTACTGSATTGTVLDLKYNFSLGSGDNGNVMGITNNRDTTRTQSFSYDSLNRLLSAQTAATSGSNCWGEQYGYDAWGNLLSISAQSGYSPCTQENLSVSVDTTNRLSSSSGFYYDTAGNLTQATGMLPATYSYDAQGQLASASTTLGSAAYIYDGDGRRVAKATPGTPPVPYKLYWYGDGSDPLDESDGSGTISAEYIFFGGKRIARRDSSGHVDYYFEDHLGTSRVVTDSSGTVLDDSDFYPFGAERPILSSSGNVYKFMGKERDSESGLDDFGARYYSSGLGRFISSDWSAVPVPVPYANLTNPQTLNLYAIVHDNPETFADLDGHQNPDPGAMIQAGKGPSGQNPSVEKTEAEQKVASAQNQSQTKQLTADDVSKGIKAFDSDKGDKNPGRVVKALDTMGKDFTVSGDTLKQGVKESGVEMPKAADKVLANVESITRTGDKVVITNKDSMRIKLLGEIGKTISFTINESVKGKSGYVGPALQDLKGVGIGIGPFATHPDHWGPE
jgi:RHS repeat-associated protein